MASIQKLKKGSYRARVYYYDAAGKRRTISKNFSTQTEAKDFVRITENELKKKDLHIQVPPFKEYMEQYIETFRIGKVSESSVQIDKDSMKRLLKYYDDDVPINKINGTMHQKVINQMFDQGYSLSTIKKNNGLMFRVMERAVHDGLITFNPAELIEYKITDSVKNAQYIPRDKIKPFLNDVKRRNIYHYYLFRFILETGTRVGEALAVTYDDFNIESNFINITKSYDQKRDKLGNTKTKHHRSVYFSNNLKNEISQLIELHETNKKIFADTYNNSYNFIFVDYSGAPLSRSSVHNSMIYCSKKVLGEGNQLSVHKLRHTYATLLLQAGVPMKVIQERLGHQSMEMTERIYAHVTPEMQTAAQSIFEESIQDVF